MRVTKEWIHANKTENGGWTARQLKCLGVSWPPTSGWIERIEGDDISDDNAKYFSIDAAKNPVVEWVSGDTIITTIGIKYFEIGHNCIPWEHCAECAPLIAAANW